MLRIMVIMRFTLSDVIGCQRKRIVSTLESSAAARVLWKRPRNIISRATGAIIARTTVIHPSPQVFLLMTRSSLLLPSWNNRGTVKSLIQETENWLVANDLKPNNKDVHTLRTYLEPKQKPKKMSGIYLRMIESLINGNRTTRVILGPLGEKSYEEQVRYLFSDILFEFDPNKVLAKYSDNAEEELYPHLWSSRNEKGRPPATRNNLWRRFTKGVLSSAKFLTHFDSVEDFYAPLDKFRKDKILKPLAPLWIKNEVYGFGFALASDFIKELGFKQYGKPDVQIRKLFSRKEGIGLVEDSVGLNDYWLSLAIDEVAELGDTTPYCVDKLFWLVGSGNYYNEKPRIKLTGNSSKKRKDIFKKHINNHFR